MKEKVEFEYKGYVNLNKKKKLSLFYRFLRLIKRR